MLKKILVANRGEIALRILRSAREMGIETVAVYSQADRDALFVKYADEAVCIGENAPANSYLDQNKILTVALGKKVDGIHPGYGFLSESYEFAKKVQEAGITFIGPHWQTIELMGDKSSAKHLMKSCNVPVIPGSEGIVQNLEDAVLLAQNITYPLLLKATAGGGGKGIRLVRNEAELKDKFFIVQQEAEVSFGDGGIYMEKFLEHPVHIEVQILADHKGNVLCLGERECSLQRNHQKMVEESPSLKVSEQMRQELYAASVLAAKSCNYLGAGTIEFLLENQQFYFLEMNTRIQVEHPVTEMVTGIDLVKEQLRIAAGLPLRWKQEEIHLTGHSIEMRLIARDPMKHFAPQIGRVNFFQPPGGMNTRMDTDLYSGIEISPYYDAMIGKIIVRGENRMEAIKKIRRALEETVVDGISTNLWYLYTLTFDRDFLRSQHDNNFLEMREEKILEIMRHYYELLSTSS